MQKIIGLAAILIGLAFISPGMARTYDCPRKSPTEDVAFCRQANLSTTAHVKIPKTTALLAALSR